MAHQGWVLVVEDEPGLAEVVGRYLVQAGLRYEHVEDGREVMPRLMQDLPDLVLLDLMLPGRDGLDLCREIRQMSSVPIIMMTARSDEIDRLLGLELGADDYICKPFSPRELVARVKAVLRRTQHHLQPVIKADLPHQDEHMVVGPLMLDSAQFRVEVQGQVLDLTPREFQLLKVLMRHPGRVFTRAQLLDLVCHDELDVSDRLVDSHVKNLRKKLSRVWPEAELVQAVYGMGYRLQLPV
ncbi:MAG: response regulator [Pseudomonadales bacterium]|nr:response regulator [Pseudomonadales bacterium]